MVPMKTVHFRDEIYLIIEWSSSGLYIDGSFIALDIMCGVVILGTICLMIEQHAQQISLVYTLHLPIHPL